MSKVFSHIQSGISNAGLASDPSDPQNGDLYYNTTSNVFRQYLNGAWSNVGTSSTSGTVTSVSVVSANGLAGTVATATTTPALTLSTTITGILQGNGTAISAATTTGTGEVVLQTSPTLITPTLGAASATSLSLTNALTVPNGGTGVQTIAANGVLIGNGTGSVLTAVGAIGTLLQGNGVSSTPSFVFTPTLGLANTNSGTLGLANGTSAGVVTLQNLGATANYNFNLPSTAGTSGYFLTSAGGASSQMTWTAPALGTVTSVTFTGDGTVLSSTPSSAVTTSGTLTATLNTQSANTVLAGPSSGSAAAPTFRHLVAADLTIAINNQTASYALTASDQTVAFSTSSSALAATLPTAVGISGKVYNLVKTDTGAGTVNLTTTSSQTVGGLASTKILLASQNDSIRVVSDGSNWQIIEMNIDVAMRWSTTSTTVTSTPSIVKFGSNNIDTYAQYSSSTGNYTIVLPGRYQVSGSLFILGTYSANQTATIRLLHNGSTYTSGRAWAGSSSNTELAPILSDVVTCAAGDTLSLEGASNSSSPSYDSSSDACYFCVTRIGN